MLDIAPCCRTNRYQVVVIHRAQRGGRRRYETWVRREAVTNSTSIASEAYTSTRVPWSGSPPSRLRRFGGQPSPVEMLGACSWPANRSSLAFQASEGVTGSPPSRLRRFGGRPSPVEMLGECSWPANRSSLAFEASEGVTGSPPSPGEMLGACSWPANRSSLAFQASEGWCGRGDSNPHGIATASPSSWCVCQFRHFRLGRFARV
jgi:hypothetical protein